MRTLRIAVALLVTVVLNMSASAQSQVSDSSAAMPATGLQLSASDVTRSSPSIQANAVTAARSLRGRKR